MPIPVRCFLGIIYFLQAGINAVDFWEVAHQAELAESSQLSLRALGTRKRAWLQANKSRVKRCSVFTVWELK